MALKNSILQFIKANLEKKKKKKVVVESIDSEGNVKKKTIEYYAAVEDMDALIDAIAEGIAQALSMGIIISVAGPNPTSGAGSIVWDKKNKIIKNKSWLFKKISYI